MSRLILFLFVISIGTGQIIHAQQKEIYGTKGYRGFVEAGYTIGTGIVGMDAYGIDVHAPDRIEISITNGYLFTPYFYAGIGIGYTLYPDESDAVVLPAYLDLRYNFRFLRMGRCYPFLNMKFGIEWVIGDEYFGGNYYTVPAAGIKWELGKKTAMNFSIGYAATDNKGISLRAGFEF